MKRSWLRHIGRNTTIGRVNLGKLGEKIVLLSGASPQNVPFFRYRRLIVFIDTKE